MNADIVVKSIILNTKFNKSLLIQSNHYPDFMVMMKSGRIVIVEAKGDDRDNGDSRTKLKLGQTWAAQAGRKFRYFMTFDHNSIEGAYDLEDFAETLKDL